MSQSRGLRGIGSWRFGWPDDSLKRLEACGLGGCGCERLALRGWDLRVFLEYTLLQLRNGLSASYKKPQKRSSLAFGLYRHGLSDWNLLHTLKISTLLKKSLHMGMHKDCLCRNYEGMGRKSRQLRSPVKRLENKNA